MAAASLRRKQTTVVMSFTLGKSSERDPGEHWTAFWRDRSRLAYPCRLKRRLGPQN
jgi:hypothetical protein